MVGPASMVVMAARGRRRSGGAGRGSIESQTLSLSDHHFTTVIVTSIKQKTKNRASMSSPPPPPLANSFCNGYCSNKHTHRRQQSVSDFKRENHGSGAPAEPSACLCHIILTQKRVRPPVIPGLCSRDPWSCGVKSPEASGEH